MGWREKITKAVTDRIRAYHSSPHDFDKVDMSKIGSGQGAQTYGHGFYAAENPAVSGQGGQYWQQFKSRFSGPELAAAEEMRLNNFDRAAAIDNMKAALAFRQKRYDTLLEGLRDNPRLHGAPTRESLAADRQVLELLESGKPVGPRTYEVDIKAKPEQLLDWDKPIGGQKAFDMLRQHWDRKLGDPDIIAERIGISPGSPGGRLHAGIGGLTQDYVGTANMLRDAGIPGIRYLDQGSRPRAQLENRLETLRDDEIYARANNVGIPDRLKQQITSIENQLGSMPPPTSNYVMFDPGIIDIVKKYGVPGIATGGIGAFTAQDSYEVPR
jgi:hypothetical protein